MNMATLADAFFGLFNYWIVIVLMMIGFYTVISHDNLVKKLIGLGVFQSAVFFFYISMGKISGSTAPILTQGEALYAHPLPHVLILTAIVVGVSTTALGLALVVRINEAYDSIEEDDILVADFETRDQDWKQALETHRTVHTRAQADPGANPAEDNDSFGPSDAHSAPKNKESPRS